MTLSALLVQLLNGLAGASSLFLVGAGLSLIFGVTRIVNFAHGSLIIGGICTPRLPPHCRGGVLARAGATGPNCGIGGLRSFPCDSAFCEYT